MRVLIVGCGLAGLATAIGLVTRTTRRDDEDDGATSTTSTISSTSRLEIVMVERRTHFQSRGATFGLARNGQVSLEEIAPPSVLETFQAIGIHMPLTDGYMLPWWKVRDTLLQTIQGTSPYQDMIQIYMGCVVDTIENLDQDDVPVRVSFAATTTTTTAAESGRIPETQDFDLVIGADGVHSQIRTKILALPPPIPTDTVVWRGSVDTNIVQESHYCQAYPSDKMFAFRPDIVVAVFNFHEKVPGIVAWICSCRNASKKNIVPGTTTPLDLLRDYRATLSAEQEAEEATHLEDAIRLLEHTSHPSELAWPTEMAVVDLDVFADNRWGGKGRVTIIGDAAHSIRPASGLGGSLAFEDAALMTRALLLDSSSATTTTATTIPERLAKFEAQRLPRCRSISRDQTLRSTLAYQIGFMKVPAWDPAYADWVWEGPHASPHPPVDERQVFSAVLSELEKENAGERKE